MALETQLRLDTMGQLRVYGGGGADTLNPVQYVEGDVKVSGLGRILNELVPQFCRGQIISVGYGDRRVPQISFTERLANYSAAASPGPIRDALCQQGFASTWTSTKSGPAYCVHIELKIEASEFGGTDDVLKFEHCHFVYDFSEGRPSNTNAWTGMILGRVLHNGVVICREINTNGS